MKAIYSSSSTWNENHSPAVGSATLMGDFRIQRNMAKDSFTENHAVQPDFAAALVCLPDGYGCIAMHCHMSNRYKL